MNRKAIYNMHKEKPERVCDIFYNEADVECMEITEKDSDGKSIKIIIPMEDIDYQRKILRDNH